MAIITEICLAFNIKETTIRSWCKTFKIPFTTNANGIEVFNPGSIKQIKKIHHLMKDRGFAIAGVKKELQKDKKSIALKRAETIDKLEEIKGFLSTLKESI